MEKSKISVVLCSYNGEQYIAEQIQSIIEQTVIPDELIISDDCSRDSTVKIVNRIVEKCEFNVKVFQNKRNIGFIKNFEKAIKHASGSIIFLSDQDDFWFKNKIELMIEPILNEDNTKLVYSDAIITDSELRSTNRTLFDVRKNSNLGSVRSDKMLIKDVAINGCTIAFDSTLKHIVIPIEHGWGHEHWIAIIAHAVAKVSYVNKPLLYYRRHRTNSGNDPILIGGLIKEWDIALSTSTMDDYQNDINRWKLLNRRLRKILNDIEKDCLNLDKKKLEEFLSESELRESIAVSRGDLKNKLRVYRIRQILYMLIKGYYHSYLNGFKSSVKDILIP